MFASMSALVPAKTPRPPMAHSPSQNRLLAALPAAERGRLIPHLELVALPLGQALYNPGMQMRHVYFPTSAILSLLCVMENGAAVEVGVVGNEGLAGVFLFMGGDSTCSRTVVQHAGYAFQLSGALLNREFFRAAALQALLLRYTQALLTQMSQTVACIRHHSLDQQLCRWLLQSVDRQPSNELKATQELIARMLGVRRESVTEAAGNLKRAALIRYRRGHITVLDRAGLQARACECYDVVKKEFDRLVPAMSQAKSELSIVTATASSPTCGTHSATSRSALPMAN